MVLDQAHPKKGVAHSSVALVRARMHPKKSARLAALTVFLVIGSSASAASNCEALASLVLPDTIITTAQLVSSGSFQPPSGPALEKLPEFCRVAGRIQNHPTSRIMFEVWLPTTTGNQRFVQVGNGGFAGTIRYANMATRLREGYATANTDDGTSAAPGVDPSDRLKLLGDLERVHDFKGRAVILTAGAAKSVYSRFYGSPPRYSYFTGESSGGLEALAVVQRIGDQFDGVSAGCPANNSAGLFTQAIWTSQNYQRIASKLSLIHGAALATCDSASDGVRDGVIGDPLACKFDPAKLRCSAGDQPNCLTDDQVEATRRIYAGPVDPRTNTKTGEQYAPGMPVGSELVWGASRSQALGASQPWYGMVLHNSLTFNLDQFRFDSDVARALALTLPHGAQVTSVDLSSFRSRGGKLLMWAGWNDPLWSQTSIVDYYTKLADWDAGSATGSRQGEVDRRRRAPGAPTFARLFMAPGMGHCAGGDGPNVVDTFAPLVRWVEGGLAPEKVLATKYVNDQPAQGVALTRPICAYPLTARWIGRGDASSAEAFVCTGSTSSR